MNILYVIPSIDPHFGGPSKAVLHMASLISKRGHEVTVCFTVRRDDDNRTPTTGDESFSLLAFPRSFPSRFTRSTAMNSWLRDNVTRFNIVHINTIFGICSIEAGRICRKNNIPYIVRPHGSLDPYDIRKKAPLKRIIGPTIVRTYLQGAAAIHCTSELEAQRLVTYGARVKTVVVGLPVNATDNRHKGEVLFREHFGFNERDFVVLYLSRIDRKKNLHILISAVKEASKKNPEIKLAVCGTGTGAYEKFVQSEAAGLVSAGIIRFCGQVDGDLKDSALRESDVLALPSDNENYAVAVVEALHAGLPVLITKGVYIWEAVQRESAGIVSETSSQEELATKLSLLAEDKKGGGGLLKQLSVNAKHLAEAHFSDTLLTQKILDMYQDILERKR